MINEDWHLVDLPGYGWAQVSKTDKEKWKKMIDQYLLERRQLINVFVLIDVRHLPQKIDMEFMQWLGESQIPFSMIFTKADKLGKVKLELNVDAYNEILKETWEELPPQFVTSAENKMGREEVIKYILDINKSLKS